MTEKSKDGGLTPPPYLSPSSLDTFLQCPLKFKYSRIDRLVDPPTEATTLGSFVHAVLEDMYRLNPEERTMDTARQLMSQHWFNTFQEEILSVLGNNTTALREFRWRAWWCVENFFKLEDPTTITPAGIEHELNSSIAGVPIRGFIDRWTRGEEGIVITDYKTGKTPQPRYMADKYRQLLIYGDILSTELDEPLEAIELLYLKDGVRKSRKTDDALRRDIDNVRSIISQTYEQVLTRCDAGVFEPTPNRLCDWCSYKSFCPAWANS